MSHSASSPVSVCGDRGIKSGSLDADPFDLLSASTCD